MFWIILGLYISGFLLFGLCCGIIYLNEKKDFIAWYDSLDDSGYHVR